MIAVAADTANVNQDVAIDRQLLGDQDRPLVPIECTPQQMQTPGREQQAQAATEKRQQKALGKQLAH